jgi:hypothetical protein
MELGRVLERAVTATVAAVRAGIGDHNRVLEAVDFLADVHERLILSPLKEVLGVGVKGVAEAPSPGIGRNGFRLDPDGKGLGTVLLRQQSATHGEDFGIKQNG